MEKQEGIEYLVIAFSVIVVVAILNVHIFRDESKTKAAFTEGSSIHLFKLPTPIPSF